MYKLFLKRLFDFIIAFIAFIVLSPIFVIITISLYFSNKGKPFFFQNRPGLHEKAFKIIKFKSMNDDKDSSGKLLSDSERLTKVGAFVRKTSLDEIPQLLNVINGDMSLVGPRPLLMSYLPYYTEKEKIRHNVRPGITGLAQVNGRNTINWDDRLRLDTEYVENLTFSNDVKILIQTIKNVINRKDIVVVPSKLYMTLDKYRNNESKT